MPKTSSPIPQNLIRMNPGAAAIDIGSTMHMAAVNPDCAEMPIRSFGTFTHYLHDLAAWSKSCGVSSVAMESTGVYWIPAFEILKQHGFEVILVNARYVRNVPGRKTDVSDAVWLRQLHSYDLLRSSFRPNAQVATLRAYLRQRERLVEYAAAHIQHMQKALMEMNLQLHHVVSDITGVTGMKIILRSHPDRFDPDSRPRLLACAKAHRLMRNGSEGMALRQALYIVALPRTRQQDLRRQSAVITNSSLVQSSDSIVRLAATTIGRSGTALGAFY